MGMENSCNRTTQKLTRVVLEQHNWLKYLEFNLHVTQFHLPSDEEAENRDCVIKQSTVCFEIR